MFHELFRNVLNLFSKWIFIIIAGTITSVILVIQLIAHYSNDLPDYTQLESYDPPVITRVYSLNSDVIAEYAQQRRICVQYDKIPKLLIHAILAAEDKNFFEHQGIDVKSLFRATLQSSLNILTNKRVVGGSTITQQLVKSFFLTRERSLERKIKEAILSYRISHLYSKEKVLELYMNQIFLGNNSYGVVAASRDYFNKNLEDLNVAEVAMLAALPKAPSALNPFVHYDKAKKRRDWVIQRMYEEDYITAQELQFFTQLPIQLAKKDLRHKTDREFYIDAVKRELISLFGEEDLYTKGFIVNTYLNDGLQAEASAAFRSGIKKYDKRRGWRGAFHKISNIDDWREELSKIPSPVTSDPIRLAVVLGFQDQEIKIGLPDGTTSNITLNNLKWARSSLSNPKTARLDKIFHIGDVILVALTNAGYTLEQLPNVEGGMIVMEPYTGKIFALVGGYDFTKSYFNRAIQAQRQPGSAFKPFVYLSALEEGYPPNATIEDSPISISQGAGMPYWNPKNYGNEYLGLITMRTALEKSRNIPTIKIVVQLGVDRVLDTAKRFGIYDRNVQKNYSVALGAAETTLIDLTTAYNAIASSGIMITPKLIDSVYDKKGNILYKNYSVKCVSCENSKDNNENVIPVIGYSGHRVADQATNYQLISMLNGAMRRGTGAQSNVLHKTLAGKTGTTNNSFDAWFVGFSPYITAGVYVGYDQPQSMGKKETGATLALPIFIDFMKNTSSHIGDVPFAIPNNIILQSVRRDNGQVPDDEDTDQAVIVEAFKYPNMQKYKSFIKKIEADVDHLKNLDFDDSIENED